MISTIILLIYNLIRVTYKKLHYNKRFASSLVQRISPFCSIKLYGNGKIVIERNCEFAHGCDFQVHGKGTLKIGEKSYFNSYCMISAHKNIEIGKCCMFGPGVKIFDNNHRFTKEDGVLSSLNCDDIVIGNNCWIASDVIILKGTRIGNNCVIGAGCIVRGEIPDNTLVKCKQQLEYSDIK